jgi:hypothetical protein
VRTIYQARASGLVPLEPDLRIPVNLMQSRQNTSNIRDERRRGADKAWTFS